MKKIIRRLDGMFHCSEEIGETITTSMPFQENSDQYQALLAEGCIVDTLSQSSLDLMAKQKKEKIQSAINLAYNLKIKDIVGDVPQSEIDTWSKQEAQAHAWTIDGSIAVPFIQNLATQRGIELSELVRRILQKAAIYEDLSSKALGQKQAQEDAAGL